MLMVRTLILVLFLSASGIAEDLYRFSAGAGVGYATLSGGAPPWFTLEESYAARLDTYLKGNWRLEFNVSKFSVYDDTAAHSEFQFGSDKTNRLKEWKGYDLTALLVHRILSCKSRLSISGGIGGGISIWKMIDAQKEITLKTSGPKGESVDFAATEITAAAKISVGYRIHRKFGLDLEFQTNYLTGAGREFSKQVEEDLGRWNLKAGIFLNYLFGKLEGKSSTVPKKSQLAVSQQVTRTKGSQPDPLIIVSQKIDGTDSDSDGILDEHDFCPNTPVEAAGMVDIKGCPVDSDCDGTPDYLDKCPHNPLGALVGQDGCPLDADHDGISDGLDNCPETDSGIVVDRYGCVDLSILQNAMILYIDYESGSFEIDRKTKMKLEELARTLVKVPGVRVEINGYSDNIGTPEANLSLTQKRANRVRDYLVSLGIDTGRLMAIGRGEAGFVASNDTREGRQQNRRVELIFFR